MRCHLLNVNRHSFVIALGFLILSIVVYCYHFIAYRYAYPLLSPDEASFISPAYDLIYKNKFSTSLHASFLPGADRYTYWMPPLYMVTIAFYLKIVGFSLLNAKLFSFSCFLLSAVLLSFITTNKTSKLWIVSVLLSCPFVIIASSTIRMEAIGFLATCLSILVIKKSRNIVALAVVAGAMIMIHPLFWACSLAIGFTVLNRQNWRELVTFILISLLVISPYIWYIMQNPAIFWEQMALQLNRKSGKSFWSMDLSYFVQFAPLSAGSFVLLYRLKQKTDLVFFLKIGLVLVTLLICMSQEFNYHLNVIPYSATALALYVEDKERSYSYRVYLFLVMNVLFIVLLYQKLKKNDFLNDHPVCELIEALKVSKPHWDHKAVFVSDNTPDLSCFLLLDRQRVERMNAIVKINNPLWYKKYDCVVAVSDTKRVQESGDQFWSSWRQVVFYKTKNKRFTFSVYRK